MVYPEGHKPSTQHAEQAGYARYEVFDLSMYDLNGHAVVPEYIVVGINKQGPNQTLGSFNSYNAAVEYVRALA